jgi:peptidoglycan/LPS O-acetylase OafA/YrhL
MNYKSSDEIEACRGAAALAVAAVHTREVAWVGMKAFYASAGMSISPLVLLSYLTIPVMWGGLGVPVFFVISGYCIHKKHATLASKDKNYRMNVINFYSRRITRIYPVLILAIILTIFLDAITRHYAPSHPKLGDLSLRTVFGTIFAINQQITPQLGTNGALWSLAIEIQLYLFYPFLFWIRRKYGIRLTSLLVCFVSIASGLYAIPAFTTYLLEWCLGAIVAEKLMSNKEVDKKESVKIWAISRGLAIVGLASFQIANVLITHILIALAFSIFLYQRLIREFQHRSPVTRALAHIGKFSYSLYATHLPVVVCLSAIVLHGQKSRNIGYAGLFYSASIIVAYACYLSVERKLVIYLEKRRTRDL